MLLISCLGPETTVTNFVNRDGSIMRKVEMKNTKNEFQPGQFRVPVDSTWTFSDTIIISAEGDTTWYLYAEKLFTDADQINLSFLNDSGTNRDVLRTASFERKFRWFTTHIRYSEKCTKSMDHAPNPEECLSAGEIEFMKLPAKIKKELISGSDSLKFRSLRDSLNDKSEIWYAKSMISEFIEEAGILCASSGKGSLTADILSSHENEFFEQARQESDFPESCSKILGPDVYDIYKTELDSALKIAEAKFDRSLSFDEYTMQVVMPAKVISTNGYQCSGGEIAWPVTGDLFLNADYIMFAESRYVNYWAIIVTAIIAIILPFDIAGHIKRWKKGKM